MYLLGILAWSLTTMPGQSKILMTGKLGSVMQESAQAAFSLVKSRSAQFKIRENDIKKKDLHIHIPEGAVPKDGPSAGIALATALVSAMTGIPVRKDIAMTGEVTLRGRVLGVGGLKEKVLAAFREGVKTVLYPKPNNKDLPEIPENIRKKIKLIPVETIEDVFKIALPSASLRSTSANRKPLSLPGQPC